jgi:hypothetical protein
MTNKYNNSNNFKQVHGSHDTIIHNQFLDTVQNLFQFEYS